MAASAPRCSEVVRSPRTLACKSDGARGKEQRFTFAQNTSPTSDDKRRRADAAKEESGFAGSMRGGGPRAQVMTVAGFSARRAANMEWMRRRKSLSLSGVSAWSAGTWSVWTILREDEARREEREE